MSFFFGGSDKDDDGSEKDGKSTSKMVCHYEILMISDRTVPVDEIKKAYKKAALKWHPDRNFGKEKEAEERFKEVQNAYNVLSDPHERKWYDDHRTEILRGNDGRKDGSKGKSTFEDNLDLWQFFNATCYDGMDDGPEGFFTVYSHVYENLLAYENNEDQQLREPGGKKPGLVDYPPFGDSLSSDSDTLNFYNQWQNFVSILSFSWEDEYNPAEADQRQARREIEKLNKKAREAGRRKYVDLVRALVSFVRKRDPRILRINEAKAEKKRLEQEKRDQLKAEEAARKEAYREALARGEIEMDPEEKARREKEYSNAYLLADESSDEDESEWAEVGGRVKGRRKRRGKKGGGRVPEVNAFEQEENEDEGEGEPLAAMKGVTIEDGQGGEDDEQEKGGEGGEEENEEEEDDEPYKCVLCSKAFKSDAQLAQHLTSKAHRKAEKDAAKGSKGKKPAFVKRGKSATD